MRDADPYDPAGDYDYPEERGDARLLGVSSRGEPIYYDPVAHVKLVGERKPKEALPAWATRRELASEVDVEALLEEVEEAVGWDALTDFAREHIPGVDDAGTGANDDAGVEATDDRTGD